MANRPHRPNFRKQLTARASRRLTARAIAALDKAIPYTIVEAPPVRETPTDTERRHQTARAVIEWMEEHRFVPVEPYNSHPELFQELLILLWDIEND